MIAHPIDIVYPSYYLFVDYRGELRVGKWYHARLNSIYPVESG